MNAHALDMPASRPLSAEEYMRAKLSYETSPHGLNHLLEGGPDKVFVLDVRDPASYEKEHIRGARNIPENELSARRESLPKGKTIVTYSWDATCALAPQAAMSLAKNGFRVQLLAGGLEEWRRRDLPVEKRPLARRGG